jgi:hypothetical protein
MSVDIMEHVGVSISMPKIVAKKVMAAEVRGLVMANQVFEAMRNLLGDS